MIESHCRVMSLCLIAVGVPWTLSAQQPDPCQAPCVPDVPCAHGVGNGSDEVFEGTECPDQFNALGGDDILFGRGGSDGILVGGPGNDVLHGGDGDDHLLGDPGNDFLYGDAGADLLEGAGDDDYLEGGVDSVADEISGGTGDDLLVGRAGKDKLFPGPGEDFVVIVGNSLEGYTVQGNEDWADLLFFARDANPEMVYTCFCDETPYRLLRFDLQTAEPVNVKLADAPSIEAVVTGSGDDELTGTDFAGLIAYEARFEDCGQDLEVNELFFSGAGDDVVRTMEGDDYVDAGPGDDTVILGSGSHYILTGSGSDLLQWQADALCEGTNLCTVKDFAVGDRIHLLGSVVPRDLSFSEREVDGLPVTTVLVDGDEEINLEGVRRDSVRLELLAGGVEIRALASLPRRERRSVASPARSLGGGASCIPDPSPRR